MTPTHTTTTFAADSLSPRHFQPAASAAPSPFTHSLDSTPEEQPGESEGSPQRALPPPPPPPRQRMSRSGFYPEVPNSRVAEEYARTALEDDCGPLPTPGQQRPANALAPAAAPTASTAARPKTKQRMKS